MSSKTNITLDDVKAISELVNALLFINEIDQKAKTILDKLNQRVYELYKDKDPKTILEDNKIIDWVHELQLLYLKSNHSKKIII